MIDKENLKKRLLNFPINLQDKVEIWLILRDLKPATDIFLKKTLINKIDRSTKVTQRNLKIVENFLKDNNLFYKTIDQYNHGQLKIKVGHKYYYVNFTFFDKIFFVSKKEDFVESLYKAWTDLRGVFEPSVNRQLGILYGFPKEAVEEYVKAWSDPKVKSLPDNLEKAIEFHKRHKGEYWESYVSYIIRKGHDEEDTQVAKRWADCVRNEFPELALKFEKFMAKVHRFK